MKKDGIPAKIQGLSCQVRSGAFTFALDTNFRIGTERTSSPSLFSLYLQDFLLKLAITLVELGAALLATN